MQFAVHNFCSVCAGFFSLAAFGLSYLSPLVNLGSVHRWRQENMRMIIAQVLITRMQTLYAGGSKVEKKRAPVGAMKCIINRVWMFDTGAY